MNIRQEDFAEIDEFYSWIRDYWGELSSAGDGTKTNVLNFGYWRPGCGDLYQAQMAFFDKIVSLLGTPGAGDSGVEVGCGIGGYAVRLLEAFPCRLTCYDLLELHLQLTRQYAEEKKVAERLVTVQGSSMDMARFDEDQLDFVYCIESSFHYDEKQKFFNEVYRAMKPGAVFVFADISCEDNARIAFRSGNHFSARHELDAYLGRAGFDLMAHLDIGGSVYAPLHAFIKAYNAEKYDGGQKGLRKSKVARYWELVLNNYAQLNQLGLMGYQLYQCRK